MPGPISEILHRLNGAYAESTLRAYGADFRTFGLGGCRERAQMPLTATPEAFVAHVEAEAGAPARCLSAGVFLFTLSTEIVQLTRVQTH